MNKRTLQYCRVKDLFCLRQRLSMLLLLLAMLKTVHSQANGISPKDSSLLTMSLTNAPLEKAFAIIRQQTPYRVIYDNSLLKKAKPVTVAVDQEPLPNVLLLLFRSQPFDYRIMDHSIIITPQSSKPGTAYPATNSIAPPANDTLITGFVVADSALVPLPGASIQVKGTNISAVTDDAGRFQVRLPERNATLVISYVEYSTKNVQVNEHTQFPLTVLLIKTPVEMGEVTVYSTGYETLPKERATGSFEMIDNKLFNRSVTTNVLERLDGIVPGLIFNRRIGTDNRTDISIRGISTLNSDMRPLIVVDNFPYSGNIENLNPNDIETITVLKDAAAASIWGANAGNGVIVITTKSGRYNEKLNLSVNTNITIVNKPDLYYVPQFSSSDFIDVETFLYEKGFYNNQLANTSNRPVLSPVVEILSNKDAGTIGQEEATLQMNALKSLDVRQDYLKYLHRKAINQQSSASVTGGSNTINYLFSFGHDKNIAANVGNEFQRFTIRSQTNFKPTSNIDFYLGIVYTHVNQQNNSIGTTVSTGRGIYPYARLADNSGNHLVIEKDYRGSYTDTAGNGRLLDWKYRPLDEASLSDNTSKMHDILLNFGSNLKITPWLKADIKYQFENQVSNTRNYYDPRTYYTRNLINLFTPTGGNSTIDSRVPFGGILDRGDGSLLSHALRGQLSLNEQIGSNHALTALLGGELRQVSSALQTGRTYGYDDEVLTFRNVDQVSAFPTYGSLRGQLLIPNGTIFSSNLNRFVSWYGNASYTYKRTYGVYASARNDASNLFGVKANNKWKPLWSGGVLWNISNEDFYRAGWLPSLKLRLSYGYNGNVNNNTPGVLTLQTGGANWFYNLPAFVVNNPPNPNLRWEEVRVINMGIDFSMANSRLTGSLEYYTKKSYDLINSIPADPTSGYSIITVNNAEIKGNGIDLSLVSLNVDSRLKWRTGWQFSFNNNKVIKYLRTQEEQTGVYIRNNLLNPIEGQNAHSLLSYRFMGLDPDNGDPLGILEGKISKNYDSIRNFTTFNELLNHGSSRPLLFGSVMNTLSWKGFSLSANLTYRLKYYFRKQNILNYYSLFENWSLNGYNDYLKRWQNPGDEKSTHVPSMIYPADSRRDAFYASTEVNVQKGDHIRLQDISIGYDILARGSANKYFKSANIYCYISNLGIIWKANTANLDPDYETPPPVSISLGLKANF